ncbi:MAG: N-acetylmuramoyl-L-alanine amidase-like domain-containing protein [Gemmatimonadales bacterium]
MSPPLSRRDFCRTAAAAVTALLLPPPLTACTRPTPDEVRLAAWSAALRAAGLVRHDGPLGPATVRVGEEARGTPYRPGTLDAYLRAGGSPDREPLTVSLTRFDCVTLVESCLAVARVAGTGQPPTWERFGREIERMRYRGGKRQGYASRLHYFSEWISDGARRGLVRDLGKELGGAEDVRSLRFMTEHRASYPALRDETTFQEIQRMERTLDPPPRFVVPTKRIPQVVDRIETGDVLAFATEIPGLDVTHAALAYRGDDAVLRVLHAPLSGGVVEITGTTLPEYVAAIRRSTGILVARPAWA